MTNSYRLDDPYGPIPPLELNPGTAFALYMDRGPKGPCGQCMNTTCDWAQLHLFDTFEELKKARIGRNGVKAHVIMGVVGEWSSPGHVTIVDHREQKNEHGITEEAASR